MAALTPMIEAAKNAFAAKHQMVPDEPRTLEAFFTHHVLLHRNLSDFAAEQSWRQEMKILVGGANDAQLDAVLILVNNEDVLRPGDSLEELEQAVENDEPVQISFIFVQATGAILDDTKLTQKMSAFSDGVLALLDEGASSSEGINENLRQWVDLKRGIFEILKDGGMSRCCDCSMFFVSPRKLAKDPNISRMIALAKTKIMKHQDLAPLFHAVDFINIGADRLERMIAEESERRADLTIAADRFIQPPVCETVDACYFGYLTAKELLAFITEDSEEEEDALRHGVFAANIRSFLGTGSAVNSAIAGTLRDARERKQFGLRSNGLSIIAKSRQHLPDGRIRFSGAQIVNGCQSSHVIFANRENLRGRAETEVWLPAKIIVTDDKATEDAAILGLNRQTPVHEAQIFTEKNFVDRLAFELANGELASKLKIQFEKREGEFKGRNDIEPSRIITLYEIARTYVAAFLERPELVASGGKQPIIDKIREGMIFGKSESVTPYCVSAVMLYHGREAVKRQHPSRGKYPMNNMLHFAMRLLAERAAGANLPDLSDGKAADVYFAKLETALADPERARKIADAAARLVVDSFARGMRLDSKSARSPVLAAEIRARAAKNLPLKGLFGFLRKA